MLCDWDNPNLYSDQLTKGDVSYPTDSPIATKLGLCSNWIVENVQIISMIGINESFHDEDISYGTPFCNTVPGVVKGTDHAKVIKNEIIDVFFIVLWNNQPTKQLICRWN